MLTWANTLMAKGITRSDIFVLFFVLTFKNVASGYNLYHKTNIESSH